LKFRFEITLLLFIFATTAILQGPYLFEFPGFIHGWAQVDRYALSLGFLRNGFDLFHPETYVYNHIYPGDFLVQNSSTVSAVDFPLHDYVVAAIMGISSNHAPWIFRIYVIVAGCLFLFFLGKLAQLVLKDTVKTLMVVVFAALSPVFVYYQGSLLPSIPSLALAMAGIYYYMLFRTTGKERSFYASVVLFALALLSRTTFVIPFIALLGLEFLQMVRTRKVPWMRVLSILPVVLVFMLYRMHNDALRLENGSMFLHRLIPAESMEEVRFLLNYVWEHWRLVYFSSIHYGLLAAIGLGAIVFVGIKKLRLRIESFPLFLLGFTSLYLLGCLLFAVAMLKQFQDHDYYFLDTFYLPFLLVLVLLLSIIPRSQHAITKGVYWLVLVAFIGFAFRMPVRSQRSRHEAGSNNRLQNTIENFVGSASYLDSLGVSHDATMLVIDAVAPNMPLTLMDRKGLVMLDCSRGMIEHALKWDYDYIVFQNEYFMDRVYRGFPEILRSVRKVGSNGRITVCVKDENVEQTIHPFLGLGGTPTCIQERVDFETEDSTAWRGFQRTTEKAHSGMASACFTLNFGSGLTMEFTKCAAAGSDYHAALVSMFVLAEEDIRTDVVMRMTREGKEVYHEVRPLSDYMKPSAEWQAVELFFVVPPFVGEDTQLSFYLSNNASNTLFYDDIEVSVY
jgi:hypothetical protein